MSGSYGGHTFRSDWSESDSARTLTIDRTSKRRTSDPIVTSSPEQLCDLHVYKVPLDLWRTPLNNILNQSVTDTVSLGIIRVPPDLPLIDLRAEITRQLEDQAPKDYVFLRSVGRSLTWLKSKQEIQLKAKHFLPPVHYAPELFLLEANPEMREALAISDRSSQQSPSSLHHGSTGHGYQNSNRGYGTYRDGYRNKDGYPGLTPEDQYKNRDKENFYLALQNKSKDMQNRLSRDRFNVDDDDDDRLKDMDERTLLDRERWEADQRDRRRRAADDPLPVRGGQEARGRRGEEESGRRRREEESGRG
ncbi:hypothetical protein C0Q70_16403 [Pomacea canaliculata]|uniref:Uncharacterized protein n=1 Tax=Pomacea canaliculata TaxID=400727 RepID=A0A2T7NPP3_POMCA|nr:hypothetical protein C0Q70_16403 [Pomacea canaliculata]